MADEDPPDADAGSASDADEAEPDDERHHARIADGFRVTLPASVREHLGVRPGDAVRYRRTDDGEIVVELVRDEDRSEDA